jgi:Ca-activated chloride channel family protein
MSTGLATATFDGLHFLRPAWLWALLALPAIAWLWRQRLRRENAWRGSVDAHLLPYLLEPASNLRTRGALAATLLACALAILALAGPAWRQIAQPSWQSRTPLVIALDLSSATAANDLPPSRLLQARAKIATLLRERNGGQVGLVAFADDAYTVAPLTDDAANVALFLDALAPDVMPVDGHRPDRAIRRASALLRQAGFDRGDVVLLTDHGDAAANAAAQDASRDGVRVSVLGLGTPQGAMAQAPDGSVSRVSLDAASLRALASAGDGAFATIAPDDGDLRALGVLQPRVAESVSTQGRAGRSWKDEGYWLLLPLMGLALFAFRRGAGVSMLCAVLLLPAGFAHAQAKPEATLWRRADQVEAARMDAGEAAYRKGDFPGAASRYEGLPAADAQYNLGNALAKQGRYDDAIAAYDAALRAKPGMPDALANKRAVEAAKKRKPPPGQGKRNDPRAQGKQDGKDASSANGEPKSQGQQKQPQPGQGTQSQQAPSGQRPRPQRAEGQPAPSNAPPQAPKPGDAQEQRAADAAQRERMQRALEQARAKQGAQAGKPAQRQETPQERERRLANEAWLRRVPDDPGGLLRAKFRLEYERRQLEGGD